MTSLGSNAHIFARSHRREQLRRYFADVLGCPVVEVRHPGYPYCFLAPGGQVFTIAPAIPA